jgi:hypothetical protein
VRSIASEGLAVPVLVDGSTRDALLAAEYLLFGAVVVHSLPRDGWIARRASRPYRAIVWQTLRVVVGMATWPTVFLFEWIANGGRLPLPEDSWIMELLRWPYASLLRQAGTLAAAVGLWPLVFAAEWARWLPRLGSRRRHG